MCTKKLRWSRTCTDTVELILGDEIKVINGDTAVQKVKKRPHPKKTFGFDKEDMQW